MQQFNLCISKIFWENINNRKKLAASMFLNIVLLLWIFFQFGKNNTFSSFNGYLFLLIYAVIWCVLMSFTLVNDIISETNKTGIVEQLFLSTCDINRYVFFNVLIKNIFTTCFLTIIFGITGYLMKLFSFGSLISFFVTITIGSFSLIGIGYIIACISVLFHFEKISIILRLVFLVVILRFSSSIFIPYSYCKEALLELFINKHCLWNLRLNLQLGLVVNSILYFTIGYCVFATMVSKHLFLDQME